MQKISRPRTCVKVKCEAPDIELLFVEWLNAIIFEMATRASLRALCCADRGSGS